MKQPEIILCLNLSNLFSISATILSFDDTSSATKSDSIIRPRPRSTKIINKVPDVLRKSISRQRSRETSITIPHHDSIKEEYSATRHDGVSTVSASVDEMPVAPPPISSQSEKPKKKDEVTTRGQTGQKPVYVPPPLFAKGKPRDGNWL